MPAKKKIKLRNKASATKVKAAKVSAAADDFMTEPLAVGFEKNKLFLLFRKFSRTDCELYITSGKSDTKFDGTASKVSLTDSKKKKENIAICSDFRFSCCDKKLDKNLVLTYTRNTESGKVFVSAESKDGKKWTVKDVITKIKTAGIVAYDEKGKSPNIYFGDHILRIARKAKTKWEIVDPPRAPHWNFFDGVPFSIAGGLPVDDEFAVFYCAEHTVDILKDVWLHNEKIGEERLLKVGVAIFDKNEPTRLLWQTELPVIEVPIETHNRVRVLGVVPIQTKTEKSFRIYTASLDGQIGFINLPGDTISDHKNRKQILLKKWQNNPILSPTDLHWEKDGAFNPTALRLGDKVHLLYRAVGGDGYSSIGYASSSDGLNIDERLAKPVYSPKYWFEKGDGEKTERDESIFSSGGSWGGCEDPKVTQIGDKVYMTYVAHTGVWPMRTVLTSISVDDFLHKKWKWEKSQLMSPPGVGSKSVVLFPEKINGNYYIFHRMWPNIMLDIVPELEFGEGKRWLTGEKMILPRKSFWDSLKMSVGSTPIKTKDGWLIIYNAVDRLDGGKYKIGAMLLDLNDPSKVLARCRRPILTPSEFYENDGKPGIAYPGGAVNIDGMLHVYYGGGDKVCCVAQIEMEELLKSLKKDALPKPHINKVK